MGTKTVYDVTPSLAEPPEGCVEAMTQVVARHGSRHSGHITEMNALARKLAMSPSAPAWLKKWQYPATVEMVSLLTTRGLTEHYELARRMSERFQGALPPRNGEYTPVAYPIRSTFKSRAAQSAEAFALGALEAAPSPVPSLTVGATAFVDVVPGDEDAVLRFFDICANFDKAVNTSEYTKYLGSSAMQSALVQFRRNALGLLDDNTINVTVDDLLLAYEACAYEYILNMTSGFCSLIDNVAILEYAVDIENWYENAGGNPVAAEAPFVLLRDIVDTILTYTSGDPSVVRAKWRFAHAETILPFATLLGLFETQPPLLADHRDDDRLFKTSVVAPMAANIVATLYHCESKIHNNAPPWRLKWALNEQDVILPACNGNLFCPFDTFTTAFADALFHWDFASLCGNQLPGGPDADLARGPRDLSSSSSLPRSSSASSVEL